MLYIVATPIGNIREITYRAVDVLKSVDFIAAEDTRHTMILLNEYGIKKPMLSYQKFNERERTQKIIEVLKDGKDVALVSDAGMPLISDPGSVLVSELIASGIEYTVVSGPCAAINAAVLSGMDVSGFAFAGFLPEKTAARNKFIAKFANVETTLIFYCPPHNVLADLDFLYKKLGERKVSIVREISKLHEEVIRGTLGQEWDFTVKGEIVVVVEGAKPKEEALNKLGIEEHIRHYLESGLDKKEAVKRVAADRGVAKSVIYARALELD